MATETQDANQALDSSTNASTGSTGGQEAHDQTSGEDGGPSNPALLEVAQKAYEKSIASQANDGQQTNEQKAESSPQMGQDQQRKAESANGQPNGQQQATQNTQAEQVPFHDHPRWKEVMEQRNGFEQRANQAEQRLQTLKPVEDQHNFHRDYMQRYGITDQDVANAMEFLAMQRTNPARALEMLKPIQESLRDFDPNVLPKDLQAMVENNDMTPAAAKLVASERARANQLQRQVQQNEANAQVTKNQATNAAIQSWDKMKRGVDPDFKPKASANAPDGLWEFTARNFAYEQTMNFAKDPAEAARNLEKAYSDAKTMVNRLATPRTPVRQAVTSSQSSTATARTKPKNAYDVTKAVAAKYGINYTPPSENNDED